jgi:DNA-binding beta-propeller fold protein YncE
MTTLAGNGQSSGMIDGVGIASKFSQIPGMSLSPDGSFVLICDRLNNLIRHLVLSTASVTTFAGIGLLANSTNGVGTIAKFNNPFGVSISSDGLFALVTDLGNQLIRHIVISTANVTTLAGVAGSTGANDGMGTIATFHAPCGITISPDCSFALVSDANKHLIRYITLSTAVVTTLAGVAANFGSTNGVGTNAMFNSPIGISISPDNLFTLVADSSNNLIRHIVISTANVSTLVGARSSGSTNGVGTIAKFFLPYGLSISPDGMFALVADFYNNLIRVIDLSTTAVSTLAGMVGVSGSINGIGTNAKFNLPTCVNIAPNGTFALVVGALNFDIRRLSLEYGTASPSLVPTFLPSIAPTAPSFHPTLTPSLQPTLPPSLQPSSTPSFEPSALPSTQPTAPPSQQPTLSPSLKPTAPPTLSMPPTGRPSLEPTHTSHHHSDNTNQKITLIIIGTVVGGEALLFFVFTSIYFLCIKPCLNPKISPYQIGTA